MATPILPLVPDIAHAGPSQAAFPPQHDRNTSLDLSRSPSLSAFSGSYSMASASQNLSNTDAEQSQMATGDFEFTFHN
jgi:hypothetical protein